MIKTRIIKETPLEAIKLAEDQERMLTALHLIQRIDPESITKDKNKGWSDRAAIIHALKDWHNYARKKLMTEYLNT